MSHRSKTDFFARARAAGYRTYLYFIATESSHLNIYRVRNRTALGGHMGIKGALGSWARPCLKPTGPSCSTIPVLSQSGSLRLHPKGSGNSRWQLTPCRIGLRNGLSQNLLSIYRTVQKCSFQPKIATRFDAACFIPVVRKLSLKKE